MPGLGRKIKPGQVLNPNGARGKGIAKKDLKRITQQSVADAFNHLIHQPVSELKRIVESTESSGIDSVVAKAILVDIKEGHMANLGKILERVIGPIPQVVKGQYSGPDGEPLVPPSITFAPLIAAPAVKLPDSVTTPAPEAKNAICNQ